MITDSRHRGSLTVALALIEQVAAEHQAALEARTSATLSQNPGPLGVGRMLALGRDIERLELIAQLISQLLGPPPPTPPRPAAAEARAA